jgi:hypothetical protein
MLTLARATLALFAIFAVAGLSLASAQTPSPPGAKVYFINLKDDQLKAPIPMDDTHKHFGNGQTEAMITLPPGKHTLQLVLGDWSHVPHVPPVMSDVITITVH